MYRIVTLAVLRAGVDLGDVDAIGATAANVDLAVGYDPEEDRSYLAGEDVSVEIRGDEVTKAVSAVSAVPAVRTRLVQMQRELAAGQGSVVVEGRDIGSTVWPDAAVKVFLSADASARATRRAAEEGGSDVSATEQSLRARDEIDSGRAVSPLVRSEGAVHIDTTAYSLDEVIERVVALVARHDTVGSDA